MMNKQPKILPWIGVIALFMISGLLQENISGIFGIVLAVPFAFAAIALTLRLRQDMDGLE